MDFVLPRLQYDYDALTPHIDERTMRIHYEKHHAAYTQNLNDALSQIDHKFKNIEGVITGLMLVPAKLRTKVRNNAGGHLNHSMFWKMMTPKSTKPSVVLKEEIDKTFGSLDNFKEKFSTAATSHFGSGWVWLCRSKGVLRISTTRNQDNPLIKGDIPILGLDVWEHAYYLKYQNKRADYVKAWWNVVNWNQVNDNYGSKTKN